MKLPLIVTVILNTNRCQDTLEALTSLRANTYSNQKALVLDNASVDGSVEAIRKSFPEVEVISLHENRGYAGNNNVGIRAALNHAADWVFVLNEDTLLAPDCLDHLVDVGESDRTIGVVGPMVYHNDEPTVIQSAGGILGPNWESRHIAQNEPDHGQFPQPHAVDWISGCAIMIRREVIEKVGALDERFFYYWEETEWCLRVRQAGWLVYHAPQARIWHKGVQKNYKPSPSVTYYSTRNRFLLLSKHHAPFLVLVNAWAQTLRTLISWSVKPQWRDMRLHRDAMWQGTLDFINHRWGMRPQ